MIPPELCSIKILDVWEVSSMAMYAYQFILGTDNHNLLDTFGNTSITRSFRGGRVLVHILSLKSNIWKLFGHINYRSREDTPGILFNGALHWFWFDATYPGYEKVLIVSFDLAKEEFIDIPQPDDTRYVWSNCSTLGIIEGRLCIFCKQGIGCFDKHNWSIWAMKSYNGKPSWELLPIASYMLKDSNQYRITPPPIYFCDDNLQLSRSEEYMSSPIFVQTLVSPYVNNNNGGPSHTKNNKSTVNTGRPRDAKNSESTVSNGRSSHAKNNKSNDSWKRIGICKEKRELEEEEKEEWNKHIQERACLSSTYFTCFRSLIIPEIELAHAVLDDDDDDDDIMKIFLSYNLCLYDIH
ncbi:putative F-box domain-containing protein [Tanacetum coccineum]